MVLGGYVGRYLEPYLDEIKKRVAERCNFETDGSYLHVTQLDTEASALGAALCYINEFVKEV